MKLNPWEEQRISLGWPDEQAGPFAVQVHFACAERWECVGFALEFLDPAKARPLETSDLRSLRLPLIVERAYAKLGQALQDELTRAQTAPPGPAEFDALERHLQVQHVEEALEAVGPRKAGRPPLPRVQLEKIAEVYCEAFYRHEPPTQAVATYLGCGKATAAQRVALCRKRGILVSTQSRRGRGHADRHA